MSSSQNPVALRKRLDQKVRTFMLDRQLVPASGSVLVAVSGGPDSTALLLILDRLARYHGFDLHAAYFDHGLRSEEERQEEAACVGALCGEIGRPLHRGQGDVRGLAGREGLSIEDAARRERYAFLARTAAGLGCTCVATGHTASDQAETVLMHIIRGAGLDGLAAMAPDAPWPFADITELRLIRPLLCLSREETLAYCSASEATPVEDESNASLEYVRNRVRHELLPLLRTFNPKIEEALVRLADASREVRAQANASGPALARSDDTELVSPGSVRSALAAAAGDLQGFSARNVASVRRLLVSGHTGDRVDLPRGLRAEAVPGAVVLQPQAEAVSPALPDAMLRLHPEMPAVFGSLWLRAGNVVLAEADAAVEVDAEAAEGLYVRRRRDGDRFQPLGMTHTKKLQDFFVDEHVPRGERDSVPIFLTRRGIIWVGGMRLAHWARPRRGHATVWLSYRRSRES